MKKYFILLLLLIGIVSCSKDGDSDETAPEEEKIINIEVNGVFSDNDLVDGSFVSFNKTDGYFCAKFKETGSLVLLSGTMIISGNTINVTDEYTNNAIKIEVKSLSSTSITFDITYTDFEGATKNRQNLTYKILSGITPSLKNNTLVGNTYTYYEESGKIYTKLTTNYSGQQSKSSLFAYTSNTRNIHYIYIDSKLIFMASQLDGTGSSSWNSAVAIRTIYPFP